ncbi:MAG: hypothetical protein DI607_11385, partial [Sphingomonas hengshuiensis]
AASDGGSYACILPGRTALARRADDSISAHSPPTCRGGAMTIAGMTSALLLVGAPINMGGL